VRRRRLGAELRRYRESAGLTIADVATLIECSASKISRMENAQTGASPQDVQRLLGLYRVGGAAAAELVEMAAGTHQRGWWQPYGSVMTGAYVAYEAAAAMVCIYEMQAIPGLVQTEEYARSLILAVRYDLSGDEVARRVRLFMARQSLLTQEEPTRVCLVIEEAALLRPVGGPQVMREQFEHLAAMATLPHVELQVIPVAAGPHPGLAGSFVILRFADTADPDTVYVPTAAGGVFYDKGEHVRRYAAIFDKLRTVALSRAESAALFARRAKEQA
jgi:hypothetical protein